MITTRTLTDAALEAALEDVARLRIEVFRAFPYLYDGDLDYERRYMSTYQTSAHSVVVGAFDGPRLIGAATGTPLEDHPEFAEAFTGTGEHLDHIFYCAESVLLPDYRGQGIGHRFFDAREEHARQLGRRKSAFCAVIRAEDHPAKPQTYSPLNPFWRKRGYHPLAGVVAQFRWKDIDQSAESAKALQFWIRTL